MFSRLGIAIGIENIWERSERVPRQGVIIDPEWPFAIPTEKFPNI